MKQFKSSHAGLRVVRAGTVIVALALIPLATLFIAAPERVRLGLRDGLPFAPPDEAASATLWAGDLESGGYTVGARLAEQAAPMGLKLAVTPTAGAAESLASLLREPAGFAVLQTGPPGIPEDITALAWLTPQFAHVVVPADSSIETFRDLEGKRIAVGAAGSGDAPLAVAVFDFFQFTDPVTLLHEDTADLASAFAAGTVDAAFTLHSLFEPAMETLLGSGYYRLLPIPEAEALAAFVPGVAAVQLAPGLYGPGRTVPPMEAGPWSTLQVQSLLVAGPDAAPRAATDVLAALFTPGLLAETRLGPLTEADAIAGMPIAVHPAATAYYQRSASLTEAAFADGLIAMGGIALLAGVALYLLGCVGQYLRVRRRLHVEPVLEALADLGGAVDAADSPAALEALLQEVAVAQRKAERRWLRGELTAGQLQHVAATALHLGQRAHAQWLLLRMQQLLHSSAAVPETLPGALTPPAPTAFEAAEAPLWWNRGDSFSQVFQGAPATGGEALLETVRVRGGVPNPSGADAPEETLDTTVVPPLADRQEFTDVAPSVEPEGPSVAEVASKSPSASTPPTGKSRPKEIAAVRAPVAPARRRAPKLDAAAVVIEADQGSDDAPSGDDDPAQLTLF